MVDGPNVMVHVVLTLVVMLPCVTASTGMTHALRIQVPHMRYLPTTIITTSNVETLHTLHLGASDPESLASTVGGVRLQPLTSSPELPKRSKRQ